MRTVKIALWSAGALLLTVATASADVQLSIADGRVSLVARDATVRQILAEWARVGQTRIVNGERVPGGPVTLELRDVPEAQALDIILRSVSGYMAAPRQTPMARASQFDRIIVMPTSAPPPAAPIRSAGPAQTFPQPVFPQPGQPAFQGAPPFAPPQAPAGDDQDDSPQPAGAQRGGPVFNSFPPPQISNPQQPVQVVAPAQGPLTLPSVPGRTDQGVPMGGAATPGVIVQPPQQQQQGQPVIPGQPRRPGGGE